MYYTAVTPSSTARMADAQPASPERTGADIPSFGWSRPRVLNSQELRELAGQWRTRHDPRDPHEAERAEKIATVLEWLALQREPKPKTRLQAMGERISAWVGLH